MKLSVEITKSLGLECWPAYHELMIYHPCVIPRDLQRGRRDPLDVGPQHHLGLDTARQRDPRLRLDFPMEFDSYADGEGYRLSKNVTFAANVEKQIMAGTWLLRPLRRLRKNTYLKLLNDTSAAHNSFWSNKPLPPTHKKYTYLQ